MSLHPPPSVELLKVLTVPTVSSTSPLPPLRATSTAIAHMQPLQPLQPLQANGAGAPYLAGSLSAGAGADSKEGSSRSPDSVVLSGLALPGMVDASAGAGAGAGGAASGGDDRVDNNHSLIELLQFQRDAGSGSGAGTGNGGKEDEPGTISVAGANTAGAVGVAGAAITDRLDGGCELKDVLRQPNVDDDGKDDICEQIMTIVNGGIDAVDAGRNSCWGTTIIEQGTIKILTNGGRVQVCGPGRWSKLNPRSDWGPTYPLNAIIQHETLTIVRVPKGKYGFASENGVPVMLAAGLHVRNSRTFAFDKFQENNIPKLLKTGFYVISSDYFSFNPVLADTIDEYIDHQTIRLVRVPKNYVTAVMINNKPRLLEEGTYHFNTQFFVFVKKHCVTEEHVQHNTISRLRVTHGKICAAWFKNKPIFISKPGTYEIDDKDFIFVSMYPATNRSITLGSRTRFLVYAGEIGLLWNRGVPQFITDPGVYERDDPAYLFVKCVPSSEKLIELGSKRRIVVMTGEVGIGRRAGKLVVLEPAIHFQERIEESFEGFLSVQTQQIPLVEVEAEADEKGVVDLWVRCDTQELVEIGIKAALFYEVSNPELCISRLGSSERIQKNLRDTGISTLQGIMRSSNLNQVAQSKVICFDHENKNNINNSNTQDGPIFFDKVHDEFLAKLQSVYVKEYGITIANIRIEDFKLMNVDLARNISNQAMLTAKNQNELANLASQKEIAAAHAERDAYGIQIQARAAAAKLGTDTEAKSRAIIVEAETSARRTKLVSDAEAESAARRTKLISDADAAAAVTRIESEAKARAYSIRVIAEAEAEGIRLKSEAEKKRAENLASTEFGKTLTLAQVNSEMMAKCFQGVNKMVYLPNDKNLGGLPLQFYGSDQFLLGGGAGPTAAPAAGAKVLPPPVLEFKSQH